MAHKGKSSRRKRAAKKLIPVRPAIDGSELCLQCGMCCDGTLFPIATLKEGEQAFAESLGLVVESQPDGSVLGFQLRCPRFVDGGCSIYAHPRPHICGAYHCELLKGYEAGTMELDEALPVVQLFRSLARELEVSMGIPAGHYTRSAVQQYLAEIETWIIPAGAPALPPALVRFLVAFHRLNLLGVKYFGYSPELIEERAAAAGAKVAAGASPA